MAGPTHFPDSIAEVKRVITRYHGRFALACFLAPLAVLGGSLLLPRHYEGEASFERRNDLVMAEITDRGAPQAFNKLKQSLAAEVSGLTSIEKAVRELGLVAAPAANADEGEQRRFELKVQELTHRIKKNLRVQFDVSTPEVDRVRLVLNDEDPRRARAVVNRLVENYMVSARAQVDGMLSQASSFFEQQVDAVRSEIEGLEHRKLAFELEKGELLPDEYGQWTKSMPAAEERRDQARQRVLEIDGRIASLRTELASIGSAPTTTVVKQRNPRLADSEAQIRDYERKIDQAVVSEKMTDKHPKLVALRQRLAELKAEHQDLPAEVVTERMLAENPRKNQLELTILELETQRGSARNEMELAESQVAKIQAQSAGFFQTRSEYRKLERQIEDLQRRLEFWDSNLMRIRVAQTAETQRRGVSMNFIKPCQEIQRPSSPDFTQVLFAAAVLGLAAGAALVLLSYRADESFDGSRANEPPLSAPVIGAVSMIRTPGEKFRRGLAFVVGYPLAAAAMFAVLAGATYLNYRSLRTPEGAMADSIPALLSEHPSRPSEGSGVMVNTTAARVDESSASR